MRYLRRQLERIPTVFLVAYVAIADVILFTGVVPFELYCRTAMVERHSDVRFLLEILGANAALLLFLSSAMLVSVALFGRGALGALRIILQGTRPVRVRARSTRSAH